MVPAAGLPARGAHGGRLDAVVHRVADQVHERLAELVDHRLVDAGALALEDELHLLTLLSREVAHEAREALEDVTDGEHPHVHDGLLELGRHPGHLVDGREQLRPRPGDDVGDLPGQLVELGAGDDQLADEVEQVVEPGEVDPHHGGAGGGEGGVVGRRAGPGGRGGGGGLGPRRGRGGRLHERDEGRLLGSEVGHLPARGAGRLDGVAQRGRPLQQTVEGARVEDEGPVPGPGEDLLQPVDVVLHPGEADHPAVALQGVQRPEEGGRDLGVVALALEAEEGGVEEREVLARVLEVDADQLCGNLELHQREPGGTQRLKGW